MIQGPNFIYVETPFCDPFDVYRNKLLEIEGAFEITPLNTRLEDTPEGFVSFTIVRRPFERMEFFNAHVSGKRFDIEETWDRLSEETLEYLLIDKPMDYWTKGLDKVLKAHDSEGFVDYMEELGHLIELEQPRETKSKLSKEDREFIKSLKRQDFIDFSFPTDARRVM